MGKLVKKRVSSSKYVLASGINWLPNRPQESWSAEVTLEGHDDPYTCTITKRATGVYLWSIRTSGDDPVAAGTTHNDAFWFAADDVKARLAVI